MKQVVDLDGNVDERIQGSLFVLTSQFGEDVGFKTPPKHRLERGLVPVALSC